MTELADEVDKELEPTGLGAADIDATLFAQMCYPGQNFDMSVPVPEGAALDEPGLLDLAERFHDQHEPERGFCFRTQQPLVRGVRLVARGSHAEARPLRRARHRAPTRSRRRTGTRPAYWGASSSTRRSTTARSSGPASSIEGPALIEEPFTVVVVPPGARSRSTTGNYELHL